MEGTIRIGADVNGALKGINRIDRSLGNLERSSLNVGKVLGLATGALAAIGGAGLARNLVNTVRKFEDLNAQLTTVTGSARLASVALGEIEKFASSTPFTIDEVTSAFVILKRTGIDATTDSLKQFGNVAAANGKNFTQLAEAVADAATGEFERLKEFGIKVTQEQDGYAVRLGNTLLGTAKDYDGVIQKVKELGAEGAAYGKGIENRAKTLSGALSNLQDRADQVTKAFGEGGFRTAATELVKTFTDLLGQATPLATVIGEKLGFAIFKLSNFIKETNFSLNGFLEGAKVAIAVLGGAGLLKVIQSVIAGFKALTLAMMRNPFGLLAVGVASLITYLSMENGLGRTFAQVTAVMKTLGKMAESVGNYFKNSLGKIMKFLTDKFDGFVDSIISGYNAVADFTGLMDPIEAKAKDVRAAIGDLAVEGFNYVAEKVDIAVEAGKDYISNSELMQSAISNSNAALAELKATWDAAGVTYDTAETKQKALYDSLVAVDQAGNNVASTGEEIAAAMGSTATETQKASAAFKEFAKSINYVDPAELIKNIELVEASLKANIKLQTADLKYYEYRGDLISNNRILLLSAEEEKFKMQSDYIKRLDELETNALRRKMEKIAKEKGAISELIGFQMSAREKEILQNIGGQERLEGVIDDRVEFEKKSDTEKAQWAIEQSATVFDALGRENKKAFELAKAFNIANAIMNTYMAATKALATYPFPFGLIAAAGAVAAGMVQVSQIRSQTYSGRALGGPVMGNTPYMVGENGPEIFTPASTGAITRNSDIGGGVTNVNFTIQTNDASGFDELLLQRRGMITQMISDAALERGSRSMI